MNDFVRKSDVIQILKECNLDETLFEKDVFDKIRNLPTAYDIDKVIEDIMEAYGCHDCEQADTMTCNECAELEVLNDICEIVKQGGVGKDAL